MPVSPSDTNARVQRPPRIDREAAYADAMHTLVNVLADIKSRAQVAVDSDQPMDAQAILDLATGKLDAVHETAHASRAQLTEVTSAVFEQILSAQRGSPVVVHLDGADPITGVLQGNGLQRIDRPRCELLTVTLALPDTEEPHAVMRFKPVAPTPAQIHAAREVREFALAGPTREVGGRAMLEGIIATRTHPVQGQPDLLLETAHLLALAELADPEVSP